MKILFLKSIILVLFSFSAIAQWGPQTGGADGDQKEILEMQHRKLLVEVHEEDPHLLKRYAKKPEKLQQYKESIKIINERTKLAIDSFWVMGSKPTFYPTSVIKKLIKANNKEYVILSFQTIYPANYVGGDYSPGLGVSRQKHALAGTKHPLFHISESNNNNPKARLLTARLSGQLSFFTYVVMPAYLPELGEMIFVVQLLQKHFQNQLVGITKPVHLKQLEAEPSLSSQKILLLDELFVDKKLTSEEIKNVYPFPYEIVSYDKIELAIRNRDSRYAYVQFIPIFSANMTTVTHCIVNSENGELLGFSDPLMIMGRAKSNNLINADELKRYSEFIKK